MRNSDTSYVFLMSGRHLFELSCECSSDVFVKLTEDVKTSHEARIVHYF